MRWVLGGFAERIAAPEAALHGIPDGLEPAGAAMAEPLAACVHAVARGTDADRAIVLGAGTIGLMLARLLVLQGRTVEVVDRHPERRAQADALGARGVAAPERDADLLFEAAGRPEAWATAVSTVAPGGCVVLVGGCAGDVVLPAEPLHYDEVEVRGAFHHSRAEVDRALDILASGGLDWRALAGDEVGLEDLPRALAAMRGGRAHKPVVRP
jgi:L-iditol 2-dehydrogenase